MKEAINRALIPVINSSGISSERMNCLIYLREFIDRISTRDYIDSSELKDLVNRYGEAPDVVTWGDYFQTELATAMKDKTDEEFIRAFETVKFDMISSYLIFCDKGEEFFQWVENSFSGIGSLDTEKISEDDQEMVHLKILMDYYNGLGISDNFHESERNWHSSFKEAVAI